MLVLQFVSIIAAIVIGLLVVTRNTGDRNRWLLLFFNISIAVWVLSYILADIPGGLEVFWNRMVFACAPLGIGAAYLVVASMANKLGRITFLISAAFVASIMFILFTPFVVEGVQSRTSEGVMQGFDVIRGWAYPLYVIALFASATGVVSFLIHLRHRSRGRFRSQLSMILAGFLTMLAIGFTTGIILPILLASSAPANFTFLSVFAVTAAFTYAIVRQHLFDIRLTIARSLGYFLALTVIATLYIVGIFSLSDVIFTNQTADPALRAYYITAALFVAVTFGPLRRFFSRITNRVFFRDNYETEKVIGNLTTSLVGNIDPRALTSTASRILQDAIKANKIEIVAVDDGSLYDDLFKDLKTPNQTLVVTDELASRHKHIAEKLGRANVALVSRLQTHQEVIGYLICGPKIRGDALTSQDIELIRVASGELAVAMQNALRFEEISHFNEKLRQEIEEATAQLRDSNRKLRKLDEAKDEFISMASHQLRTPLTSVKGYLSMALEGDAGKLTEPQRKLLEEAYGSAQRMVYLIGDFLNVSRLQTGKFLLEQKPVDLSQMIQEEIEQLTTTAARRSVKLMYQKPAKFPVLQLDDNKMRQVVMNFIDNAIFYSRPGSPVFIELTVDAKQLCLRVKDTGIGVPASERHKLFAKFYRASNARTLRPDGTGIGLFMAKKVVVAHGGSIIFETREKKGSTFGFCLPLHSPKLEHKEE